MKTSLAPRVRNTFVALPLIAALGVAFARTAPAADSPKPSPTSASSAPAAIAPADAPPVPSAASSAEPAPPVARSIAEWIPPEETSDKPKPDEWASAVPLALVRSHPSCTASALREWLRISCADVGRNFKGVRVLGGSEKDVHMDDYTLNEGKDKEPGLHVILPVRRGDRRILSINRWEWGGYKSFALHEDLTTVISALWLPSDRGPTITVHGAGAKSEQEN